jgi:hypothetical protein
MESQFNTSVNNGKKVKSLSRFELSKKLFLKATKNGERNFYSNKQIINNKFGEKGKKGLYDVDLLHMNIKFGEDENISVISLMQNEVV